MPVGPFRIVEKVKLQRSKTSSYGKMRSHNMEYNAKSLILLDLLLCLI
jgi:hypothetical protein